MFATRFGVQEYERKSYPGRVEEGRRRRRDRHGRGLLPRHAGPADRQALPGRIFPRRRLRGDPRLRLPARQRHRHGAGAGLRGGQLGEGLWRFRHEARPGDAAAHSVAAGNGAGSLRRPRSSPPRGLAAARAPCCASRSRGSTRMGMSSYFASELEFYLFDETYEIAAAKALPRSQDHRHLHPGLPHLPDHQGGGA